MNFIISFLRKIKKKAVCKINLDIFSRNKNPFVHKVAQSIKETLGQKASPEEKVYLDKIENIRKELNNSTKKITRIDFGAGKSYNNNTLQEMEEGVEVTQLLGDITKHASKPPRWSFFLYKLILNFKPITCLEMGTCVGLSAAYQASALSLNGSGLLFTLEGDKSLASIAENNFERLGLKNVRVIVGRFKDTILKTLEDKSPFDYVFIDGHHDEKATIDYFEQIFPFLSEKALVVFDDISWSDGMTRAWDAIQRDKRTNISVDLGPVGLCIIDKTNSLSKQHFKIPI